MPRTGSTRPKPAPKPKKPSPPPTYGSADTHATGSFTAPSSSGGNIVSSKRKAARSAGSGGITKRTQESTTSASDIVRSKRAAVKKAGTGGITKRREVNVNSGSKRLGGTAEASRSQNAKTFGFTDTSVKTGSRLRRKFGGTSGGGGGDSIRRQTGSAGRDIGRQGASDGGRLHLGLRDRDLVGSENTVEEFDGSTFSGGDAEVGGGGGSGSALAGRESVGLAKDIEGRSLEEVVYGVQKRGRKVGRGKRGE